MPTRSEALCQPLSRPSLPPSHRDGRGSTVPPPSRRESRQPWPDWVVSRWLRWLRYPERVSPLRVGARVFDPRSPLCPPLDAEVQRRARDEPRSPPPRPKSKVLPSAPFPTNQVNVGWNEILRRVLVSRFEPQWSFAPRAKIEVVSGPWARPVPSPADLALSEPRLSRPLGTSGARVPRPAAASGHAPAFPVHAPADDEPSGRDREGRVSPEWTRRGRGVGTREARVGVGPEDGTDGLAGKSEGRGAGPANRPRRPAPRCRSGTVGPPPDPPQRPWPSPHAPGAPTGRARSRGANAGASPGPGRSRPGRAPAWRRWHSGRSAGGRPRGY